MEESSEKLREEKCKIIMATLRTGKKTVSSLTLTPSSPPGQRSIEGMFGTDKQNVIANMQTMQSTLLSIQETMLKMQETISKNHVEMRGDINKLDNRVEMIQQTMEKNEARIQLVEVGLDNVVKKVDTIDIEMIASKKKIGGSNYLFGNG